MTGIYLEWLKLKKLSHLYEQQCTTHDENFKNKPFTT